MPYHDHVGGLGFLFAVGFHLGMLYGVAVTFGAMAGARGGWLMARRARRPAPPLHGV